MTDNGPGSGRSRWFLWIFGVTMIATAGSAFVLKLAEFIVTAASGGPDALPSFAIPVLNYLLVASGFLCLFLWAYSTGQFRDVERPKHRMLELQREIDAREGRDPEETGWAGR